MCDEPRIEHRIAAILAGSGLTAALYERSRCVDG